MTINIGIIGTGSIASGGHAPAINSIQDAILRSVLSRDEKKGQDFLIEHGITNGTVYTTLESFCDDKKIDLVIICSPDKLHFQQAFLCLKMGKHILLEKPITTNVQDAEKLQTLAQERGLILATSFHLRSHNGHKELYKKVIKEKLLGKIRHIRAIWAFPQEDDSNWRTSSEVGKWWSLAAVGTHCIDLTRWFAQDMEDWEKFSSVVANNLWKGPHDESTLINGQFQSGITVEIVSSIQFGPYNRFEIFGENGYAICDDTMGRLGGGKISINGTPLNFTKKSPFILQLQNIVSTIQQQNTLNSDGKIGLRNVEDLILVYNGD